MMISIRVDRRNPESCGTGRIVAPNIPSRKFVFSQRIPELRKHNARVWLINTGWAGGGYGVGKRTSLKNTRAIIDAIHSGALANAKTERDPVFGFDIVTEVPGVPSEILRPREAWADKSAHDATAKKTRRLI